jgi:hypothetical protein
VLFVEARLEVTSHASARALSSTYNCCRDASLCLARVNNGSDWLSTGEVAVCIGMCPAVSGEKFFPPENAGYSELM